MTAISRRSWLRVCTFGLGLASISFVTACSKKEGEAAAKPEHKLVVFAAASLREAFTTLGAEFERAHPGVHVTFNFAGSQELRTQLEHGAPGDVFASADTKHMDALVTAGRAVKPTNFVRNEPVIVVAPESARTVRGIYDLPGLERIVLGAEEVPIGRYTLKVLDNASQSLGADFRARVEAKVVSRELNVRQVLAKVQLGEAQAGFVYRTDASAAGKAVGIVAIPPEMNVIAEYPIAVIANAAHPRLARAWVDWVLSPAGLAVLTRAGFSPPPASAASAPSAASAATP
jgi:molybdate transport system substrate-binding protein